MSAVFVGMVTELTSTSIVTTFAELHLLVPPTSLRVPRFVPSPAGLAVNELVEFRCVVVAT